MKQKLAMPFFKLVFVALIVFFLISLFSVKKEISRAQEYKQKLELEIQEINANNSELEFALAHSRDKDIIEDIARNIIGLVKSGEKIFYDVSN